MRKSYLLFACFILSSTQYVISQAGLLDKTFGCIGRVITAEGIDTRVYDAAIQTDGKILVAAANLPNYDKDENFLLRRYNSDGTEDKTFGKDGKVIADRERGWQQLTIYHVTIAIQNDEKIVIAGEDFAVFRYNINGTLDSSFKASKHIFTYSIAKANDIVIQPDGKVVVVGSKSPFALGGMAIVRYNTDGSLDKSFGENGIALILEDEDAEAMSVVLQPDGKIVAGGIKRDYAFNQEMLLVRVLPDGHADRCFGNNGVVITHLPGADEGFINSVALQKDGKIVAGGSVIVNTLDNHFAVLRYKSNGELDSSFNCKGSAIDNTISNCNAVIIQHDGKIIAGGDWEGYDEFRFKLNRYNTDGSPDVSFGKSGNGIVTTTITKRYPYAECHALALQTDGKIVAAGWLDLDQRRDIAITRYLGDGSFIAEASNDEDVQIAKSKTGVQIFPNPVTDVLNIRGLQPSTISIIDMNGRVIQKTTTDEGNYTWNVKHLPGGYYFLNIVQHGKCINIKFVKK